MVADVTPLVTAGFALHPWQQAAVDAWWAGDGQRGRGTLEIVTGGGKTLIALECVARASAQTPGLVFAVVAPTEALARQWREQIVSKTSLTASDVGLLGAGRSDTLADYRALVCVLNSAAAKLPDMARAHQPLMLIVDECHRAGAPSFSRVLRTPSAYRLGLSATPDREELDDDGEPLSYDEQVVGQQLGGVVYQFSLRDAREAGWLPDYMLHHHGVPLLDHERVRYDALSRRVDDAAESLRGLGADTTRARQLAGRTDDVGQAARTWVGLTAERKDLLYRAEARHGVAVQIVRQALQQNPRARAILFHERVAEATALHEALQSALPDVTSALEHSQLPDSRRRAALDDFRDGSAQVLVSVKSLVEGIDVPEADVGVSVASTSSVRQRIQSLGRVLRRARNDEATKRSQMHLLYVSETVDDLIYAKADWTDLTGADRNTYWVWSPAGEREPADGPPREPLPTEEQAWEWLGGQVPAEPTPWPGVVAGQEYSVDTTGTVRNAFGHTIANPQGVAAMVAQARGREGGRFRVTPQHRLVLVRTVDADESVTLLVGRLDAPFVTVDDTGTTDFDADDLLPGDPYPGPGDRQHGTFKITQRAGGLIERRVKGGKDVAQTQGAGDVERMVNASRTLDAWRLLGLPGISIHVNSLDHAWFEQGGVRRFLAHVPGGFLFPTSPDQGGTH